MIKFLVFFLLFVPATHNAKQDSLVQEKPISIKKDTVVISQTKTYYFIGENEEILASNSFDWQKNMPWIGAILLGLLTVLANILINKSNRKLNLAATERQIESAETAMKLDFNKTVLSANRQYWINDFRELISMILSKTTKISLNKVITNEELENLSFLITKAELMLNPSKDQKLRSLLVELHSCCFQILMENKEFHEMEEYTSGVKNQTQIKLKTEWERVKKGE